MNIQEIAKQSKLSITETSILLRLDEEHPRMLLVENLIDDEHLFPFIREACKSLMDKGLVIKQGEKYGVVKYLSLTL